MNLKININELAFDFLLIFLSIVNYYFAEEIFESITSSGISIVLIYSLTFLILPMLLSVYRARIEAYYPKWVAVLSKWVLRFYYIIVFVALMVSAIGYLSQYATEAAAGSQVFAFIFMPVFLIIGPICGGLLREREETILKGEKPFGTNLAAMVIVVMVTLAVMFFFMNLDLIAYIAPFESTALNVTLGVVLLIAVITITIILSLRWEPFFKRADVKGILGIGRSFIVPLLIAFIFFFLFQMESQIVQVANNVSECGVGCKIIVMLLSGIIPFRIVMMMAPPFKWMNAITGVVALLVIVMLQF